MSEARLAGVLDTVTDGILVADDQARILMLNAAGERLFGYDAEDVLGQPVARLIPGLAEPADAPARGGAFAAWNDARRETVGRRSDGMLVPIDLSVREVATAEGPQYVGVLRDLRQGREAEQRLDRMRADVLRMARVCSIGEMGAALVHELNQPMTALLLYLQAVERMLGRGMAEPERSRQATAMLEKATREAERAGDIIQRMRQFMEKGAPVRRAVDLGPLVEDAVDLTLLGARPALRVARKLDPGLPQVVVDPVQIQQVVVNLVRNALEAVKDRETPDIRVATELERGAVALRVVDNGPGIAPEQVGNLFTALTVSKGSGVGFGLAISKTIAENHGGDLTVDPGGPGRGACFTLRLPLPEAAPA